MTGVKGVDTCQGWHYDDPTFTARQNDMTREQIQWAHQHDWFKGAHQRVEGPLAGEYVATVQDDMDADNELEFSDFQELRSWAGY